MELFFINNYNARGELSEKENDVEKKKYRLNRK